ncbi:hypothetical protein AVV20_gp45 [Bacillus phage Palmer]|uniref:Uncharacterized protein n=1 Tax=Bacillus phage Palmer TaxID=1597966 RepID=A0A0C5AFI4_9CAUD|nr:hypothetical protein AVV20_gp45 [Bacillus phage Palmer]AJK28112.1 hypothetical protein CPT_Palmer45 [Bacillus phage Palmer]
MMDNHLQLLNDMLHNLKYDTLYADLQDYVPALEAMVKVYKHNAEVLEEKRALENEMREVKKSYMQTIEKLKSYKKRNQEQKLLLGQIKSLAAGGKPYEEVNF